MAARVRRHALRPGRNTVLSCEAQRPPESDRPVYDLSQLPATSEPVWALVWAALGDASIRLHERTDQTSRVAGLPLARHGALVIGPEAKLTAELRSFERSFDVAVRDEADRRMSACDGLEVELD